jgi:putative spermidine/putrescine transport system permease protein
VRNTLPLVPFLLYLLVFLLIPTITVLVGSVSQGGGFTTDKLQALFSGAALTALGKSVLVSGVTALIGAVLGAVLAWLVVSAPPTSLLRRMVTSVCSVLAQFGGVMLAFAFIATIGYSGVLTQWFRDHGSLDLYGSGWLYSVKGLLLVYSYFQIPLMVIVFLPALEGLRVQWREAAVSLGATPRQYWTQVAGPLLAPAFLGSALLLFANAFAAYATAAALISQGNPIVPLMIRTAMTSEVVLGQAGFAYALALEMIVVVAVVMTLYTLLLRRTSRWLR